MTTLRASLFLSVLLLSSACSSPGRGSASRSGSGDATDGLDCVRLVNGESVRGRILEDSGRQVVVERETVVSTYPRSAIFGIDYAKERWQERHEPLQTPAPSADPSRPSTTWLPRTDPREPVRETEVLFHDTHPFAECVGPALAKAHQDLPDLLLFAEPGGRIVLHDPKQWGYHAHLPGGVLRIPAGKPGLTIELPREEAALPDSISFVSPAQEIRAGDGDGRSSYAIPDAVTAGVKPLSAAGTLLPLQAFAGGKPSPTPNGSLWAFALPRNARQFTVYLFDPARRHGEILKAAYVGYGDTILAADLMIDLLGADGLALGRILVVPFPDNVSADGPAREPLTVYAGPVKDPTAVTTLFLPPREALQLPARAASVRAEVLISHYEVSASVRQALVVAHGVGRPTRDVTLLSRELTPKDPDEVVKIDLSSLPDERFPAVSWLYQRRTFVWKTAGGYLPPVPPADVPPRTEARLAKVRRSEGIPHVVPLLFTGTRPPAAAAPSLLGPAAQVAGGMASGLLHEAQSRGTGSSFTQNIAPVSGPAAAEPGSVSNTTYVYITSPPHTPASDPSSFSPIGGLSGVNYGLNYNSWGSGNRMFAAPGSPGTGPGGFVMQPLGSPGSIPWGTNGSSSGVTFDPRTGVSAVPGGAPLPGPLGVDAGGVIVPVDRRQRY